MKNIELGQIVSYADLLKFLQINRTNKVQGHLLELDTDGKTYLVPTITIFDTNKTAPFCPGDYFRITKNGFVPIHKVDEEEMPDCKKVIKGGDLVTYQQLLDYGIEATNNPCPMSFTLLSHPITSEGPDCFIVPATNSPLPFARFERGDVFEVRKEGFKKVIEPQQSSTNERLPEMTISSIEKGWGENSTYFEVGKCGITSIEKRYKWIEGNNEFPTKKIVVYLIFESNKLFCEIESNSNLTICFK